MTTAYRHVLLTAGACMLLLLLLLPLLLLLLRTLLRMTAPGVEGFVLPPTFSPRLSADRLWPPDLVRRFLAFQRTVGKNVRQYNLDELQRQATAAEAETLLRTGLWPWSDEVRRLYLARVARSPMIRQAPQDALRQGRQTYCERAAIELLAWNAPEGKLLLQTCAVAPDGSAAPSADTWARMGAGRGAGRGAPRPADCNPCSALDTGAAAADCPFPRPSEAWRLFSRVSAAD